MTKKDWLRKGVLISMGAAAYAQEKGEQLAKELMKKGGVTRAEGKKLVRKIYNETDRSMRTVARTVESELHRLLKAAEKRGAREMAAGKRKKRR